MASNEDTSGIAKYVFLYDIMENELINDCTLSPLEIYKPSTFWLYARNNKYSYTPEDCATGTELVNSELVGKWMLFLRPNQIDEIWNKIKEAVKEGKLWSSKVSTADASKPNGNHAVMIYTKDYRNIPDVIDVLDYIENSGLKPIGTHIKYKTDKQTRAGIYKGGLQKPWIYTSDTIRKMPPRKPDEEFSDKKFNFLFDIVKKEIINDCTVNPTDIDKITKDWLLAMNNKYGKIQTEENLIDYDKAGKWLFYVHPNKVNEIWKKIKKAIMEGDLWYGEVSTRDPLDPKDNHAILIYTKDFEDIPDVISTLGYLESHEFIPPDIFIKYITNDPSHLHVTGRQYIYSSYSIRYLEAQRVFNYDIFEKKTIADFTLDPTDINETTGCFDAFNNKYNRSNKGQIDWDKVGKWILYIHKTELEECWNKIKKAIMEGHLWRVRVSPKHVPEGTDLYLVLIHTIDYRNMSDVIKTLDYLESAGIKPPNTVLKYCTDLGKDEKERRWLYSSDEIRNSKTNATKNSKKYTRTPPHRPSRSDNSNWRLP